MSDERTPLLENDGASNVETSENTSTMAEMLRDARRNCRSLFSNNDAPNNNDEDPQESNENYFNEADCKQAAYLILMVASSAALGAGAGWILGAGCNAFYGCSHMDAQFTLAQYGVSHCDTVWFSTQHSISAPGLPSIPLAPFMMEFCSFMGGWASIFGGLAISTKTHFDDEGHPSCRQCC